MLTLEHIAQRAPQELRMEFEDHNRGFTALALATTREVGAILDDLEAALRAYQSSGSDSGTAQRPGSMEDVLASLTALAATIRLASAMSPVGDDDDSRETPPGAAAVDSAEAALVMKLHEVGYSAALGAFTRSSQASLRDFLR